MSDYAVHYAAATRQLSENLNQLLHAAVSQPHDHTVHGAIADAIEEEHPTNPLPQLIRFNYSSLNQTGHDNVHEWTQKFASDPNSGWHKQLLGVHGPFRFSLMHFGTGDRTHRQLLQALHNDPTDTVLPLVLSDYLEENPDAHRHLTPERHRWVVNAETRLHNDQPITYRFEIPHSHAHLIPQLFPGVRSQIDPHERPLDETERRFREGEALRFEENNNR